MIEPWLFVVLTLAAYRVARLVAQDALWDGTRDKIIRWGETGSPWEQKVAILVGCPYCVGVWAALILVLLFGDTSSPADYLVSVLAVSGGQAFLVSLSDDG